MPAWRDRSRRLRCPAIKANYRGVRVTEYTPIFDHNMTSEEAGAYKLAVCYEREFRRLFADVTDPAVVRRNCIPKRGDPRKSGVFRHCWQVRRETKGLLDSADYRDYIVANLTVLKLNNAYVAPNGICGDKAWIRYKVWKRLRDAKLAELNAVAPPPSVATTNPKVIGQIDATKRFLFEKFDGEPTAAKVAASVADGKLRFWVATGKVSHFYVVLSPLLAAATDPDRFADGCGFSAPLAREKCTQEVKDYFRHEYHHEFA
jgi:hypothetical protein